MKVITRREGEYTRYVCPVCAGTLFFSDETKKVVYPEYCGHCGSKINEDGEVEYDES